MTIPVRLCCGQRHLGPMCPDGKVMCCLCFDRFDVRELNVAGGVTQDICRPCATYEAQREHTR